MQYSIPFMYGTKRTGLEGSDNLGPIHDIPVYDPPEHKDNVVWKQVDAGGAESVYTVYAPCGAAGSAMYDPDSLTRPGPGAIGGHMTKEHCWLMYAPPVIIDDTYMSVEEGFNHVNMVHRTSGWSMPVTNNSALLLSGPIA